MREGWQPLEISDNKENKRKRVARGIACLLILLTFQACSAIPGKKDSDWIGYTEFGKASYYAMKFHSKITASGELYDNDGMTAAHKTLPFGTKIRVTNIKNNKSVVVKINDRGPFVEGRIIDLSGSAFSSIANLDVGVIKVKIEVIR
jgi:rare lipoprotein A